MYKKVRRCLRLTVHDVWCQTTIMCNASSYKIWAVLLQNDKDCNRQPVSYITETITGTKKNVG